MYPLHQPFSATALSLAYLRRSSMFHTQGGGGFRPASDRPRLQLLPPSCGTSPDLTAERSSSSTPMSSANRSIWVSDRMNVPCRYANACSPSDVTPARCRSQDDNRWLSDVGLFVGIHSCIDYIFGRMPHSLRESHCFRKCPGISNLQT